MFQRAALIAALAGAAHAEFLNEPHMYQASPVQQTAADKTVTVPTKATITQLTTTVSFPLSKFEEVRATPDTATGNYKLVNQTADTDGVRVYFNFSQSSFDSDLVDLAAPTGCTETPDASLSEAQKIGLTCTPAFTVPTEAVTTNDTLNGNKGAWYQGVVSDAKSTAPEFQALWGKKDNAAQDPALNFLGWGPYSVTDTTGALDSFVGQIVATGEATNHTFYIAQGTNKDDINLIVGSSALVGAVVDPADANEETKAQTAVYTMKDETVWTLTPGTETEAVYSVKYGTVDLGTADAEGNTVTAAYSVTIGDQRSIVLPSSIYNNATEQLKAVEGLKQGANYSNYYSTTKTCTELAPNLLPLSFRAGKWLYTFPAAAYLTSDKLDFEPTGETETVKCIVGLSSHSAATISLGTLFTTQFANLFDAKAKTVTLRMAASATSGIKLELSAVASFYASVAGVVGVAAALAF